MKWLLMGINGKMSMILIDQTQNSSQLQYSKYVLNAFKNIYLCWDSEGRAVCYFSLQMSLCSKKYKKTIMKYFTVHSFCSFIVMGQSTLSSKFNENLEVYVWKFWMFK